MRLLLIDGYYYVYRSFFAIRSLSNSRGEPTNAIYGFVKTVRKMMRDLAPDRAAVVWDEGLPERRTQLQPDYKAQRAEMPADLVPQVAPIHALMPLLGITNVGLPGNEADDLMASYTVAACSEGYQVILATNDKDLFQLTNGQVKIYSTNKTDLATPTDTHALLGEVEVQKKWGVPARAIGDVLALIGDSVDNIPGVAGLGPKTASALLLEHNSLDVLLDNPSAIKNPRLRDKIINARQQIIHNREMVRLDLDLPLPLPVDNLRITPRYPELIAALRDCEFKGLTAEVQAEAGPPNPDTVPPTVGQGEFSF